MLDTDCVWANGDKTSEGELKQQDETKHIVNGTYRSGFKQVNSFKCEEQRPNIPSEYRIVFYVEHVLSHMINTVFWISLSPKSPPGLVI